MLHNEFLQDPVKGKNANNDRGNANIPGYIVRRQTRNIYTTIQKNLDIGKFYLFLEDDMEFCSKVIQTIDYMLKKAERYHPNWLAIRTSYGMNGIFMRYSQQECIKCYNCINYNIRYDTEMKI